MVKPDDSSHWEYRDHLHRGVRDGALAGLLGGASIMILFLAYDALLFTPLATPDFLGQTFLGQEPYAAALGSELRVVRIVLFTALHMAAFALLGIVFSELFRITGFRRTLLRGGLYGLIVCSIFFRTSLFLSGTQVSIRPEWSPVLLGNFVAGVVMAGYLRARTRRQE